jgi:four helix bundle protein
MFGFQRLDVYQASVTFLGVADALAARSRLRAPLADQLRRAALSIPLNIAEGSGKFGADSRRFYAIARGSALECAAILDVLAALRIAGSNDLAKGRALLDRIVAMLTMLLRPLANANAIGHADANANANVIGHADANADADADADAEGLSPSQPRR